MAKPARGRPPRWRSVLDAATLLLRRTAHSPLARRLVLTVLLATLAVGIVGVAYATAEARAVPARTTGHTGQAAGAAAGERAPDRRPAVPVPSATRPTEQPGTNPARRNPPATPAAGTAGQPDARGHEPHGLGSRAAVGARTPEQAAVAWYAARLGLAAGRVRALGSQRPGPGRARVLLLADPGAGRLATTWVGLHHTPAGWTVTP